MASDASDLGTAPAARRAVRAAFNAVVAARTAADRATRTETPSIFASAAVSEASESADRFGPNDLNRANAAQAILEATSFDAATVDVWLMSELSEAEALSRLISFPLWDGDTPILIKEAWGALQAALHSAGEDWQVWTEWYDDRLAGEPGMEALNFAISTIPDSEWDRGPAHANAIIKGLIEEHATKFPQRRLARLDLSGPAIALAPQETTDPELYDRLCDQVEMSLRPFLGARLTDQYVEMRDPVELLADTLRERREVPVTVHRRCVQAAAEIARLIEKRDYLRDDFKVRTLTEDLHEAVRRIPDAVPVVAEELATRVPQAMIALGPADLARLRTVVNQVMDVSDPEVVEMIAPGLSVLERHAEGERLSDEVERMHVYALGWMLFDVSRLVRDFGALRARLVSGADQMDKLSAAINAASQLYHILLRLFV